MKFVKMIKYLYNFGMKNLKVVLKINILLDFLHVYHKKHLEILNKFQFDFWL